MNQFVWTSCHLKENILPGGDQLKKKESVSRYQFSQYVINLGFSRSTFKKKN